MKFYVTVAINPTYISLLCFPYKWKSNIGTLCISRSEAFSSKQLQTESNNLVR